MSIDPEQYINTRIRIKDEPPAFIRFIGELSGRNSKYIGLQWDDPSRGKPRPSINDTEENIYNVPEKKSVGFEIPPSKFSSFNFLKWSLIKDKIIKNKQNPSLNLIQFDVNSSIMDAIQDRYMEKVGDGIVEWRETRNVELVGMEKVSRKYFHHTEKLNIVASNHQGISKIGDLSALVSIETLDLSCNLFKTWEEVLKVFPQLPWLKELILSGNRFDDWEDLPTIAERLKEEKNPPPYQLETLVLNSTLAQWNDIEAFIVHLFPKLKEVHLCDNYISKLVPINYLESSPELLLNNGTSIGKYIDSVDLMNNEISSWEEITSFVTLYPSLRKLNLRRNPIMKINISLKDSVAFLNLESLSLEDTLISSWDDIDALNLLPSLNDLRIQQTPLESNEGRASTRIFTIARIEKLIQLNGSFVSEKERTDAEKYYLKYCADIRIQSRADGTFDENRFNTQHPRYKVLCEKYGSYEEFVQIDSADKQKKHHLVPVLIRNMATSTVDSETLHMEKKISSSMKVIELKKLCQRKWKIPIDLQKLYYTPDPQDLFPEYLDDDQQILSYYGVRVGGVILVEERDLKREEEEAKKKIQEKNEKEMKYTEHLQRLDQMKDF